MRTGGRQFAGPLSWERNRVCIFKAHGEKSKGFVLQGIISLLAGADFDDVFHVGD